MCSGEIKTLQIAEFGTQFRLGEDESLGVSSLFQVALPIEGATEVEVLFVGYNGGHVLPGQAGREFNPGDAVEQVFYLHEGALARVELATVFAGLFQRLPTLQLARPVDELRFRHDMVLYGVRELPVTW